jgi:hypothetical protein
MDIVAAGVHHRSRLAVAVFHDDLAGERQTGFLFDR